MKFRDPETGEVFENIVIAKKEFCRQTDYCEECPIGCFKFVQKDPVVAARLMGYEVLFDDKEIANRKAHWIDNADSYICSACGHEVDNPNKQTCGAGQCMYCGAYMETKEDNMEKQNKPLSEWTLGEVRKICDAHRCGECPFYSGGEPKCIVNTTPNAWNLKFTPKVPPLTGDEIAIMRAVGAKWVSRDDNCDDGSVDLWGAKPLYGDGMYSNTADGGLIATIRSSALFPSVNPGDCIELEEVER